MTSMVLGLVGGAVGFFLGGPVGAQVGFLAGTLIGSLIDPPKIQGPRLGDTKLQRSTYGSMLPYAWGHGRMGGNVIDQTDLIEHKQVSGGKGGPEITNYTYSASFAIALCARLPDRTEAILGITDMWLDGRLVWSETSGEACPCTVYTGTETQLPDPTFQSIHGDTVGSPAFGQTPAYRGIAYLVFADFDLTDYGNRIPNVEVAVFTKAGDWPWRVSEFRPWPTAGSTFNYSATYNDGVITVGSEDNFGSFYIRSQYQIDGTQIGVTTTGNGSAGSPIGAIMNLNVLSAGHGADGYWHIEDPNSPSDLIFGAIVTTGPCPATNGIFLNEYIYGIGNSGGATHIFRWPAPGGIPESVFDVSVPVDGTLYSASVVKLGTSDSGDVYVTNGIVGATKLWKFDADLNPVDFWDVPATTGTRLTGAGDFHVYQNKVFCKWASGGFSWIVAIDISTASPVDVGVPLLSANTVSNNFVVSIGGCLMMDEMGVFSACLPPAPEILADIASDITSLTPATSYDMSELTQRSVGMSSPPR